MTKHAIKSSSILAVLIIIFDASYSFAQNKVVIIPMSGESGISGYEIVTDNKAQLLQPGEGMVHQVSCPNGKVVLGGGAENNNDIMNLSESYPYAGPGFGWRAVAINNTSNQILNTLTIYAICAKEMN